MEENKIIKAKCLVCSVEFDFEVVMCCSGMDCGCMGMPIEPQVCSEKCYQKL